MVKDLSEAIQMKIATETAARILEELSDEDMHALIRPAVVRMIQEATTGYKSDRAISDAIEEKVKEYLNEPDIRALIEAKAEQLTRITIKGLYTKMTQKMSQTLRWDAVSDEMDKIFKKLREED